ncbi:Fic/DOC family protein [Plantibacter sp. CFBP 13570]|uniref:Fic/DOC family protein n=1 Tax=Plantibacter sp. CFBP 13570 TaxID=2775272 RepID=UPI001930A42E|nr:Fic family protein [Plantibacter sp. CFBP 13570]MBD8535687.1 Fic family protein [Plantibacter sp. CFBP 13570]
MPEFVDPYLDPASGVLRNRLGITDRAELDRAEGDLTEARLAQLLRNPTKITADLGQLQRIHHQLFQDVYDWAGELRTVDIRKGDSPTAEFFMPVARLQQGAGFAFAELTEEGRLRELDPERFVGRLACHYDQVNYLHPFREGNGRTQRVFWSQIAHEAGYTLDWTAVTGAANDQACRIAAESQDLLPLQAMFGQVASKTLPVVDVDLQRLLALRRASFPLPASEAVRQRPGKAPKASSSSVQSSPERSVEQER